MRGERSNIYRKHIGLHKIHFLGPLLRLLPLKEILVQQDAINVNEEITFDEAMSDQSLQDPGRKLVSNLTWTASGYLLVTNVKHCNLPFYSHFTLWS